MTCAYCKDIWYWRVFFEDGTVVTECRGDEIDHLAFGDIETDRVVTMEWVNVIDQSVAMHLELLAAGQKAMLTRRRLITLNQATGQEVAPRVTIHIMGIVDQSYYFLFEDGTIRQSTDLNAV